ncbi:hypothetical protein [Endozoicomonas sp. SCSIO W0465]|uniref:hypothetical protein n=1 Tax=Endozoicomonas sp. SCSIO W0465 TaxID=2918516 RepID=UPI00207527C7|nr:hypothetical protein [Endozoicomonas sp. SCSIO W0465]USE36637.1 hypothetical protein MJO57_32310 [Endozoicomonas sp. SCSIO W0465]
MNITGTSQSNLIDTQYISSNGNRKMLTSTDDGSVKAIALKTLSDFECQICFDVHEKPLQTRCCESVICASCYLSLPSPKKCPSDRSAFTGSIKEDLKVAGRLINNQIEIFLQHFNDVESTETDAEKSRKQNDAITQIKSGSQQNNDAPQGSNFTQVNSRIPSQSHSQNEMGAGFRGTGHFIQGLGNVFSSGNVVTIGSQRESISDSDSGVVYSNISGGSHHIGYNGSISVGSGGITINGRRIQGDNIVVRNGQVVSGRNVTITDTAQASRSNPVRTHDFRTGDVLFIDVHTRIGDITIEGQDCGGQEKVSITSSKQPRLSGNLLSLDCDEGVSIKVPESFNRNLKLHTNMGDISTRNSYVVKSGGSLHSNMGNINIKIDSMLVKVKGKSNMGKTSVRVGNSRVDWERQELLAKSNMGNINVYD